MSTLADFEQVLVDRCGFERDNIQTVVDPASPADFGDALAAEAERAEDVLLFYYVGHGLTSPGGELYLGTKVTDTRPNRLAHTALAYTAVRDCLLDSPARAIVVILDCCFSGRAVGVLGDPAADASASARVEGGFVLTASAREEVALAPPGARNTAFTGQLIQLLTAGDEQGPPELTLEHVSRYLSRELPARGYPRPRYQSNATAGDLVVAANPAFTRRPPPATPPADRPSVSAPADSEPVPDQCPYPGLAAFQQDEAALFFGREQLTAELTGRLADFPDCPNPLMLTGPSGSGKSSLLRAGLIPALKRGALPLRGSSGWPVVLFTPGADPVGELAARIADIGGLDPDDTAGRLAADPAETAAVIHDALVRIAGTENVPGARMVLVVDQFEEIFTMCAEDSRRQAFVSALCQAARPDRHPRGTARALVILGMRADFFGQCASVPELIPVLQDGQVVVGPMTRGQLTEAITRPAAALGLRLEPGLTELLLRDAGADAGSGDEESAPRSLPLLAHALRGTWQQRDGRTLTVEGYRRTGGISGAVAKTADRIYLGLDERDQATGRLLLLRLVHLGDATEDTRRRADRGELVSEFPDKASLNRVLDVFTRARLITADENTLEITHEALLRHWPLLRGWINADRAGFLFAQQITEAARTWERDGRDPSALYRGARLAAARAWADSGHRGELTPLTREFVDASTRQLRDEQHAARRRTRHLYQLLVLMTVLAVVAAGLAGWGIQQRSAAIAQGNAAIDQGNLDVSSRVGLEADQILQYNPALARQLGVAALRSADTAEARSSLIDSSAQPVVTRLPAVRGYVNSATVCGGRLLVVVNGRATVRVWNVLTPERPVYLGELSEPGRHVHAAKCSPDGNTLAVAAGNHVQLWRVPPTGIPEPAGIVAAQGSEIDTEAFSPNGQLIATGNENGAVQLWNLANPAQPVKTGPSLGTFKHGIYALAFSGDRTNLLAAATPDLGVQLWNISDDSHPKPLKLPGNIGATSVAFSPNGDFLAAAEIDGNAGNVGLWNTGHSSGPQIATLRHSTFNSFAQSVAFSPDGRFLAAGTADRAVRVWNMADGNPVANLPYPDQLTSLAFDNDTLVTGDIDGVTRLWELPGPLIQAPYGTDTTAVAVSPDGTILAAASSDQMIRLWNIKNRQDPEPIGHPLTAPIGYIPAVSFSANGHLLAAAGDNGILIWDGVSLAGPQLPALPEGAPPGGASSLAFNRSGTLLAVAGGGEIQLWDTAKPGRASKVSSPITVGSATASVTAVAFDPRAKILAAGTAGTGEGDNRILLWNLDQPNAPVSMRPLNDVGSFIMSIAFNADVLAAGCADGEVWLWRVGSDGEPLKSGQPLIGAVGEVTSLDISGQRQMLAAGSTDGDVRLWPIGNPPSPAPIFATLTILGGRTHGVAFVPGTQELTAVGDTSNIPIWETSPESAESSICSSAGYQLIPSEWGTYFPNRRYNRPCGNTAR